MVRNLDRRVEVLFPIEDAALRDELKEMLELSLSDNVKRRVLSPDGIYRKPDRRGRSKVQSQLVQYAVIKEIERGGLFVSALTSASVYAEE
jgi:polyphosphate kinase